MLKEEKTEIKKELIEKINKILENEKETHPISNIMVFNNKEFTGFMGNIRIYNPENIDKIKNKIVNTLEEYGLVAINQQHITPCCELPYDYLSFNLKIQKEI